MKILLIWNSQVIGLCGGMEKVMANFANEMAARDHRVSFVYCTEKKGNSALTSILPSHFLILSISSPGRHGNPHGRSLLS